MFNFVNMAEISPAMQQIINKLVNILEDEYLAPNFRSAEVKNHDYDRARYVYIWFLFNEYNLPRVTIRDSLPCYKYSKTIYQVIRRMYLRRKDNDLKYEINQIKKQINGIR